MQYIIYMDESNDEGPSFGNFTAVRLYVHKIINALLKYSKRKA